MPDRIEDLLRSLPDGACTECLARRDGQARDDIEAIIDRYLTHLSLRVQHGICPACGHVGRVARLVDAKGDVPG